MRTAAYSLKEIKNCPSCEALLEVDKDICDHCGYQYLSPVLTGEETRMTFAELTEEIDNAFFRLENFMEGKLKHYTSYDFSWAFTMLLHKAEGAENYNIRNVSRIENYFTLLCQLRYDFDKTDYPNKNANGNEDFISDMNDISHLAWDQAHEFTRFQTPESHQTRSKKYSISDVISGKEMETPTTSENFKGQNFNDFLEGVYDGSVSQIEQFKWAETMTNGFQLEPVRLLENDVSFFIFMKKEELESSFTTSEIEGAIERLKNNNRPIPYREVPDLSKMEKGMGKGQIKSLPTRKYLDIEKLMFPYEFFTIYRFQSMLKFKIQGLKTGDLKKNRSDPSVLETRLHASEILQMPVVKNLSQKAQKELITKLAESELPFQVAILATIGFTEPKINTTFISKVQLIHVISELLGAVPRAVKGNINVLNAYSKEDKKRYTSYLHVEDVKDFIANLK
ncbi:hypothetical protein ACTJKC_01895 [Pedobacter sp. 22226]|uniref:hypothetical protein n=1 Tax=Pedobacter sp. 22226 TaxID=3453894 RepID=UPI003F866D7D